MAGNRSWTIKAVSGAGAALSLYRGNERLFSAGVHAAPVSPVEHLLIGAAGCFALSCRAVLNERRAPAASIEVTAVGIKAAEPPSRVQRIELTVRFGDDVDEAEAASIIEGAERLCTVTNTLLGSPGIEIEAATAPPLAQRADEPDAGRRA